MRGRKSQHSLTMTHALVMAMQIHVLGGFLGSGKTTLLMRIANAYIRTGKKVAVLVNEMGDIGVDGATLASEGYNTTELPDGCVCCSLSAELQIAVRNIRRDLEPEIMLIEPTGLAIPTKILEAIEQIPGFGDYDADIIGVVDPVRFRLFVTKKGKFMTEQLLGSSIIMMNKIDVAPAEEIEFTEAWVEEHVSNVPVRKVSALTGDGIEGALKEVCL